MWVEICKGEDPARGEDHRVHTPDGEQSMKIVKCDGCGREVELDHPILVTFQMFNQANQEEIEFDICPGCWERVIELLAGRDNEFGKLKAIISEVSRSTDPS